MEAEMMTGTNLVLLAAYTDAKDEKLDSAWDALCVCSTCAMAGDLSAAWYWWCETKRRMADAAAVDALIEGLA